MKSIEALAEQCCANCRQWRAETTMGYRIMEHEDWAACGRSSGEDETWGFWRAQPESQIVSVAADGYDAVLFTAPEFVCSMWAAETSG